MAGSGSLSKGGQIRREMYMTRKEMNQWLNGLLLRARFASSSAAHDMVVFPDGASDRESASLLQDKCGSKRGKPLFCEYCNSSLCDLSPRLKLLLLFPFLF